MIEDGIALESWGPTQFGWKEESNPLTMSPSKLLNDRNLICLRKREENGVSTPHILSMRSYAHTQSKHAKRDFFFISKHAFIPLLGD